MLFNHVPCEPIQKITRETTDRGRFYLTPEGKHYPSATTVLNVLPKDGIEAWKKRVGEAEAAKILSQAGRRGTAVHDIAENYIKNDKAWSRGHMPANIFSFNQIKPIIDKSVNNVVMQEEFLWSDYLKTAGQVDLVAEFDGVLSIIDFKTSLRPKKKEWIGNYFMQEAFYAVAFEERTKIPVSQLVTIVMVDGGDPQVFVEKRDDHIKAFMKARIQYNKIKGI